MKKFLVAFALVLTLPSIASATCTTEHLGELASNMQGGIYIQEYLDAVNWDFQQCMSGYQWTVYGALKEQWIISNIGLFWYNYMLAFSFLFQEELFMIDWGSSQYAFQQMYQNNSGG